MATCGTANRQGDHGCPCGTAAARYAAMKKLPEMAKQRPKQKRGQRISDAGSRRGRFFPGRLRKTMQAREMWPPSMHSTKAGNIQTAHAPLRSRAACNAPANRMTSRKEPETRIAAHTALTTITGTPCSRTVSRASSSASGCASSSASPARRRIRTPRTKSDATFTSNTPPKSGKNHGAPMAMVKYSHTHRKARERTQPIYHSAPFRPERNAFIAIPPRTLREALLAPLNGTPKRPLPILPAKRRMQA